MSFLSEGFLIFDTICQPLSVNFGFYSLLLFADVWPYFVQAVITVNTTAPGAFNNSGILITDAPAN